MSLCCFFAVYVYGLQIGVFFLLYQHRDNRLKYSQGGNCLFPSLLLLHLCAIHNGTGICGYPYTIKKIT